MLQITETAKSKLGKMTAANPGKYLRIFHKGFG